MADPNAVQDNILKHDVSLPRDPPAASGVFRVLSPTSVASGSDDAGITKRKLFGWLSRNTSGNEVERPGSTARRGTVSSVTSNGSATDRPQSSSGTGSSLRDRFKMVRMREEAGVLDFDEGTIEDKNTEERTADGAKGVSHQRNTSKSSVSSAQLVVSDLLPPGTAAGTSTGPQDDSAEPVDWDLWQEVVYDGPAAVARTSAVELNKAIMRGIPSAIRGVVWQVLAQSKNEELEAIYRDLVARKYQSNHQANHSRSRPTSSHRKWTESQSKMLDGEIGSEVEDKVRKEVDKEDGNEGEELKMKDTPDLSRRSSTTSETAASGLEASRRSSKSISTPIASPEGSVLEIQASAPVSKPVAIEDPSRQKEDAASLQKLERAIKRDLGARTSYSKFLMSAGLQDGLFGLCKAYALFDEEVGYAQGMNFIAMPLLFNMPEEEAFCLFVRLMNNYKLRDLFIPEMPGLHLHLYQFERLLEEFEPAVYCHLHRRGVQPQLYATQWFLTLFAYRFPLQLVLRIYDMILSEGLESAILRFGIVLMQKNATKLLAMKDMSTLTTFLKERLFDHYIDRAPSASSLLESGFFGSAGGIDKEVYRADELVRDACSIEITAEMLKTYTSEWKEKIREEQERLTAEETLRSTNASLSILVRQLEERCEKSDAEHIGTASELIRVKVENQRMSDEIESLQGRIAELEAIVTKQPEEVEAKLRQEMDRVRQRNIEVQNENRALEESQQEMEQELVVAKMKCAEAQTEIDTMRQKWASVTSMMSGMTSPPPT